MRQRGSSGGGNEGPPDLDEMWRNFNQKLNRIFSRRRTSGGSEPPGLRSFGGGIWLHGSGQGKRTPDTHGCVVLDDDSVKSLEQWVRVNTPVAIFPDSFQLPVQGGRLDKKFLSMEFFYGDAVTPSAAG